MQIKSVYAMQSQKKEPHERIFAGVVKFKLIFTYFLIAIVQIGCSQEKVVVLKKCLSESTESFSSKNYICQKLFFVNQALTYKINYSFNGWQIIDSIAYQNDKEKHCIKSFQPVYDIENKIVKRYELLNIDYNQTNVLFSEIKDKYSLSREYLADLEFLLSRNPDKNEKKYLFKDGIIPSLFAQYGIPYDELLKAFSFNIKDNIINADSFVYDSFTLSRNYEYENGLLKEVKIFVKDRKGNILSKFREVFELK